MKKKFFESEILFYLLITSIITLLYFQALGRILRWVLAQPIFMADNFVASGYFYPNHLVENIGSVSIYTPGTALLALLFNQLYLGEYIYELMLFLSTLLFLYLIYAISLSSRTFSKNNYSDKTVFSLFLLFSLFFCDWFVEYALEFKPDSLILSIGFLSLFLAKKNINGSRASLFLIGAFFGIGLLFKQQHIAAIASLVFFGFFINRDWIFFSLGSLSSSVIVIYSLLKIENLKYWTIDVLRDDGFWSLKDYVAYNINFYFAIISILAVCYFIGFNPLKVDKPKVFVAFIWSKIKLFNQNPFSWYILACSLVAFAGSLKVGGNSGNSEIALLLFSAMFLASIKFPVRLKPNYLLLLSILVLLPNGITGVANYSEAIEKRELVQSQLQNNKNSTILFSAGDYFLLRGLTSIGKMWDLTTYRIKKPNQPIPLDKALSEMIFKYAPEIIIIKTAQKSALTAEKNYKIIMIEKDFILAQRNNYGDKKGK